MSTTSVIPALMTSLPPDVPVRQAMLGPVRTAVVLGVDPLRWGLASAVLPQAHVVALTGTSIVNHTFDGLVRLCSPEAYVILLGGSARLTRVLFDRRVDAAACALAVDWERLLQTVGQGATFPQTGGKRLPAMTRYGAIRRVHQRRGLGSRGIQQRDHRCRSPAPRWRDRREREHDIAGTSD